MKICYASRVISSRFVRPAHHSERIFQSPRFIQTGLSILRFQKGVTFPQPPWRPLQAAVQKLITTTLFSLERLFWIKNQFSNSKNRSQTQILEKQNATSKIFSTHCGMAWTLVGQLTTCPSVFHEQYIGPFEALKMSQNAPTALNKGRRNWWAEIR